MQLYVSFDGGRARKVSVRNATPMGILREMDLLPDMHLAFIEDKPVPMDLKLSSGTRIKFVRITSGG